MGACDEKGEGDKAMAMGIRVAGDEEGKGMKRAMALATRVECDEESDGFGSKSDGNEGGRRLTVTRAMRMATVTTWVMVMVMRLAGDKEGKGEGGKAMATVMRVATTKRQWRRQQE